MTIRVTRGYWPVGQLAGVPGLISTRESHRTSPRKLPSLLPAGVVVVAQVGMAVCSAAAPAGCTAAPPASWLPE